MIDYVIIILAQVMSIILKPANYISRSANNIIDVVINILGRAEYILNAYNGQINPEESKGLIAAASDGNLKIVGMLLAKGADVNQVNQEGDTSLIFAAANGHTEIVGMLLAKDANVNQVNQEGDTPLILAAANGYAEIVGMLLAKDADVNQIDREKRTALMYAAMNGYKEVVEMLLAKGADFELRDWDDETALSKALANQNIEIAEKIFEAGADEEPVLVAAARYGVKEIVAKCLEERVDVNQVNQEGETALILAAANRHEEIVEMLLAGGANVNQVNGKGETALIFAANRGNGDIVEILLKNDADPYQVSQNGMNALMHSSTLWDIKALIKLLPLYDLAQVDAQGNTALMWAARSHHKQTVRLLLKAGADIDQTGKVGITPLKIAAANGYKDIVKELLINGVSLDSIIIHSNTAEDCAYLIKLAHAAWKREAAEALSTEELRLLSNQNNLNFVKAVLKGQVSQIIWKEAVGQSLSRQESTFLINVRKKPEYSEFSATKFFEERSVQIAWKHAMRQKLSAQELWFLSSNAYDNDSAIKYLKTRATKITKKVIQDIQISYQETRFLDNPEFANYDFTLSKFFYNNAALTSIAVSDSLSQDAMQRIMEILPKQEAFRLQGPLLKIGMEKWLKQSYKIKVGEEERHLCDEEMRINGFTSNKILQLYKLILDYKDTVMVFRQGEPINLEILLTRYQNIKEAESIVTTSCEESKECHGSKQNAEPENSVTVYALYDIQYNNPFLNDPELVSESVKSGTLDSLLNKVAENKSEQANSFFSVPAGTQEKSDAEQSALNVSQFFSAIDRSDLAAIQELVSVQPALLNATNAQGNSALTMAMVYGHNEIASYLIGSGAYVPQYAEADLNQMLSFNLGDVDNLSREKASLQFQWNFFEDNALRAPAEEMFTIDTLSLNLGNVVNLDREELQLQESFMEDNALYAIGLLCWFVGHNAHSHA